MKIIVTDITWDTDGQQVLDLPETVTIDDEKVIAEYEMLADFDDYAEGIADYLSDQYEYCVSGFSASIVDMLVQCIQSYVEDDNEYWSEGCYYNATKRDDEWEIETNFGGTGYVGENYMLSEFDDYFVEVTE